MPPHKLSLVQNTVGCTCECETSQCSYCFTMSMYSLVVDIGASPAVELADKSVFMVFLNGQILGIHNQPVKFANAVRTLRRAGA